MSLQLEQKTVEYGGTKYELCCNMAALEELEQAYGGSMKAVFDDDVNHVSARLFRIMLNRARVKAGDEPVEAAEIAEIYSYAMLRELDIFGMLLRAMSPEAAYQAQAEQNAKN